MSAIRRRISTIIKMHRERDGWCIECGKPIPCPTIEATKDLIVWNFESGQLERPAQ